LKKWCETSQAAATWCLHARGAVMPGAGGELALLPSGPVLILRTPAR